MVGMGAHVEAEKDRCLERARASHPASHRLTHVAVLCGGGAAAGSAGGALAGLHRPVLGLSGAHHTAHTSSTTRADAQRTRRGVQRRVQLRDGAAVRRRADRVLPGVRPSAVGHARAHVCISTAVTRADVPVHPLHHCAAAGPRGRTAQHVVCLSQLPALALPPLPAVCARRRRRLHGPHQRGMQHRAARVTGAHMSERAPGAALRGGEVQVPQGGIPPRRTCRPVPRALLHARGALGLGDVQAGQVLRCVMRGSARRGRACAHSAHS